MKAKSHKSDKNSNLSVLMGQRRLGILAGAIIKTDATQEAISGRLTSLGLSDSESIELVDFLNAKAQRMLYMYSEHSVKMLELGERAFPIADQLGYEKGKAYSLLYTGASQWFTSDLDEALKNLHKAKSVFVSLDDEEGRMKTLTFEACVYRSMGDYDQSYLDLRRCVEFFRKCRSTFWEAVALMSLGMTCEQIGDNKGVRQHNRRLIKIATEPEQQWMVGRALDGIGTIYYNLGQYKKAIEYYEKSLTKFRNHVVGKARALNDLGMAHQQLDDAKKASHYYHESLRIRQEIGQREAQCTCLFNLGKLSLAAGEAEKALGYFKPALAIALAVGAKPRISQAHENLSHTYEMTSDIANALRHHKLFHKINEEASSEQSSTRAKNLRTRLELDKAEKVAEVERLKNLKLSEKNDELKHLLNELQRAQTQLVQAEKMAALGKLVAGVAHEMNSPIGASTSSIDISKRCIAKIMDMVQACNSFEQLKSGDRLEKLLGSLLTNNDVVSKANERISKIIKSLRIFSNLDEAVFQKADIHEGLDSTITLLETELDGKIRIIKQYGELQPIACYPGELNQVFLNLLTNSVEAISRTDSEGEIIVQTCLEDKHVCIKISDCGIGISAEKIKTLFDLGFTQKRTRVKAGMGLFISQNIIQKHKGKITVESKVNKGTTFTIVLPLDLDAHVKLHK